MCTVVGAESGSGQTALAATEQAVEITTKIGTEETTERGDDETTVKSDAVGILEDKTAELSSTGSDTSADQTTDAEQLVQEQTTVGATNEVMGVTEELMAVEDSLTELTTDFVVAEIMDNENEDEHDVKEVLEEEKKAIVVEEMEGNEDFEVMSDNSAENTVEDVVRKGPATISLTITAHPASTVEFKPGESLVGLRCQVDSRLTFCVLIHIGMDKGMYCTMHSPSYAQAWMCFLVAQQLYRPVCVFIFFLVCPQKPQTNSQIKLNKEK